MEVFFQITHYHFTTIYYYASCCILKNDLSLIKYELTSTDCRKFHFKDVNPSHVN